MYEATFELETLTPLFMRGADQSKAEFRSASVKGAMRWWFRALAGNYFGDNITELREAECRVFGCAGSGGTRRSKIIIKTNFPKPEKFRPDNELRYLWFSIIRADPRIVEYYPPRKTFEVTIQSYDKNAFDIALVSLWALVSLGGLGFRSRRGAGSMKFASGDVRVFNELGLKWRFTNINDLKNSINTAISKIGVLLGEKTRVQLNMLPMYPVLNERVSFVGIWDPRTWNVTFALKNFQGKYTDFIRRDISKKERIIFGLPRPLEGKDTEEINDILSKLSSTRRASPLHIGAIYIGRSLYLKILKFKTTPYYPDDDVDKHGDWSVLYMFDNEKFGRQETRVFGSLEVFKDEFKS